MTTLRSQASDEDQIRALIDNRVEAVHDKDLARIMSDYATDVLMFDVVNPLLYAGPDAVRDRVEARFSSYDGPIGYEVRDLEVATSGDLAYCTFLYRVSGTLTVGAAVKMWVRATACFRRFDGAWKITHDHESVPFNPESGAASLDLTP